MYKIIHGIVAGFETTSFTRGHNYKLTVPPLRIEAYKFSFFHQPGYHSMEQTSGQHRQYRHD